MIDGNLMVEFGIVSGSNNDDLKTSITYRYYHCPSPNKRIFSHIKHDVFNQLNPRSGGDNDGVFASLQSGGLKSESINDLNFGGILPYLHVYSEEDYIREYPLIINPEPSDQKIDIITINDDIDLGEHAWACFDEGKTGIAHSLIFGSLNVVKSGENERDGVQIRAHESDYIHLPGLEGDAASVRFGRNSFESGEMQDLEIPKGYSVEFDIDFFSTDTGGYIAVDKESEIFHSLLEIRPKYKDNISGDDEEQGPYG